VAGAPRITGLRHVTRRRRSGRAANPGWRRSVAALCAGRHRADLQLRQSGEVSLAAQVEAVVASPSAERRGNLRDGDVLGLDMIDRFDKKDFQGIKDSYEFDPVAERYIKTDFMQEARWYPTLTTLEDGRVLSVSGLDDIGEVSKKVELYDPKTKKWRTLPKERYFPTYPGLFLADKGNSWCVELIQGIGR
jgi:hypothetical protein